MDSPRVPSGRHAARVPDDAPRAARSSGVRKTAARSAAKDSGVAVKARHQPRVRGNSDAPARRRSGATPPRARRPLYRRPIAYLLLVPGLLIGFGAMVLFFYFFQSIPLPASVGADPTVLVDSAGREIGTLQPQASREDVALDELPDHAIKAVLAAEDARFYSHRGVSLPGIFRAAFRNVTSGSVAQGGSTISQQYVKNVTDDKERTLLRKVREAALAVKLEQQYSKDEILAFYLNSIYWGRGAYGIEAATKAYFGAERSAASLSPPEAALLAGIIAAPSVMDPYENGSDSRARALRRYEYVLDRLVENGWIDPVDAGVFAAHPPAQPHIVPPQTIVFKEAPFFLDLVQRELEKRVSSEEMYRGLRVTTTLDLPIQHNAEAAYEAAFTDGGLEEQTTGALVALDPATGGVRALVGGRNYAQDQFNTALAKRQPGSTFKPFALAAWIAEGNSPSSYFDAPAELVVPRDVTGEGTDWEVNNYEDAEYGELSLTEATWKSVNTVYAQVALEVGKEKVVEVAQRAGIATPLQPYASTVLGGQEVTPLELAAAYNTFAAGGVKRPWFTVQEIARDGEVLFRRPIPEDRVFTEQVAWTVTDVLQGVIAKGTGTAARIGRPAAGKTGTTQNYGDAWFAGYTPHLTAVVWFGHRDDKKPMAGKLTGGALPAETWARFMSMTLEGLPPVDFPEPTGGLKVVRPSPSPTETATEPECDDGEVARRSDEGEVVCVAVPVSEEPEEGDEPQEEPTGAETSAAESQRSPSPAAPSPAPTRTQATPSPSAAPTSSPAPSPTATEQEAWNTGPGGGDQGGGNQGGGGQGGGGQGGGGD